MSEALKRIIRETPKIMGHSGLAIGYLGPIPSFSYLHAEKKASEYGIRQFTGLGSNSEVISAVANGRVFCGVVALENSSSGRPQGVAKKICECAEKYGVVIADTDIDEISMCAGGNCEPAKVKKVVTIPIAFSQCNRYVEENYPGAVFVPAGSTVGGIETVAENKDGQYEYAAAIGPKRAFEESGIGIHGENVADVPSHMNKTRFALLTRRHMKSGIGGRTLNLGKPKGGVQCSTTIAVKSKRTYHGLLGDLLEIAKDYGVKFLEDPISMHTGSTCTVLLELDGHGSYSPVKDFLYRISDPDGIGNRTKRFNIGSHRYVEFFPPKVNTLGVVGDNGDFYREYGFKTVAFDDDRIPTKTFMRRSDVIHIKDDKGGVGKALRYFNHIGKGWDGKLVVVNSPDAHTIMESDSAFGSGEILYMHAPFMGELPVDGENAVIIGDDNFDPTSKASEVVGAYDRSPARLTFTNAETFGEYVGFGRYGPRLAASFLWRMAGELGIDSKELYNFTSPGETVLLNAAEALLADDVSEGLERYLKRHGGMIERAARDMRNTPQLEVTGLENLSRAALKSSNNVNDAIRAITGLYPHLFGGEGEILPETFGDRTDMTIGVMGGKPGVDKFLRGFYTDCGCQAIVAVDETGYKDLARDSNVVVINRAGGGGTKRILENIGEYLNGKLVVVNSSRPGHIMESVSDMSGALNILYMDAPVVKSVPMAGQNVVFIGEDIGEGFEPGSMQSKFRGIYSMSGANVTLTDLETHGKYRGFAMHSSMLSSLLYLEMAGDVEINLNELDSFASAYERLFSFAAQKILTLDRHVYAKSLYKWLGTHGKEVRNAARDILNMPDLSVDGLAGLNRKAVELFDIDVARERATGMCKYMLEQKSRNKARSLSK